MSVFPPQMQRQVDKLIQKTQDGYRPREKILSKIHEETREIFDAIQEYQSHPSSRKLCDVKKEFGDLLYALCCLSNSYGKVDQQRKISLHDAMVHAPGKSELYLNHQAALKHSISQLHEAIHQSPDHISRVKQAIGQVLCDVLDLSLSCCNHKGAHKLALDKAFILTMKKNKERVKEGYTKG